MTDRVLEETPLAGDYDQAPVLATLPDSQDIISGDIPQELSTSPLSNRLSICTNR
jgi:hypothetical protein